MKFKIFIALFSASLISCISGDDYSNQAIKDVKADPSKQKEIKPGDTLDIHNGVVVYYNGGVFHGDHWVGDYKLGQKYQCVEYVKRYYYQHLKHKMPNMWGHAVNFYNKSLSDGMYNSDRGLKQFSNPSLQKPRPDDLLVYDLGDSYGHVSIVSKVDDNTIEVVQQNWGSTSRSTFAISQTGGKWKIDSPLVLGWLRKE